MDPRHRDRIAFMRVCSGRYAPGMRLYHVRLGKEVRIADALTFMAGDRGTRRRPTPATSSACTTTARSTSATRFTEGEKLTFTGIPNFAPELFRRARAARIR